MEITITIIWKELGDISKNCFPPYQQTSRYVPWWTQRKQVNTAKRRLKRCQNQTLKEIYNLRFRNFKHIYKTELIKAKQDTWKKFCTENTKTSPRKMYKMCKTGFTRKLVPSPLNLQDGTATSTELETSNALLQKFLPDDSPVIDEEHHKRIRNLLQRDETPNSQPEPEFTKPKLMR